MQKCNRKALRKCIQNLSLKYPNIPVGNLVLRTRLKAINQETLEVSPNLTAHFRQLRLTAYGANKMGFSIINGLKMTGHHLRDSKMIIALIMFSFPALAIFERFGWKPALIYEICLMLLFILIRCWDDPVKLGYENENMAKINFQNG